MKLLSVVDLIIIEHLYVQSGYTRSTLLVPELSADNDGSLQFICIVSKLTPLFIIM